MGEFSPPPPPPFFLAFFPFFFLSALPGFCSITLLQKFTPHFKILDPRLRPFCIAANELEIRYWIVEYRF